jgi:hypothetical protein
VRKSRDCDLLDQCTRKFSSQCAVKRTSSTCGSFSLLSHECELIIMSEEWKADPIARENTLQEIIRSEQDYVKDLQNLVNVCSFNRVNFFLLNSRSTRITYNHMASSLGSRAMFYLVTASRKSPGCTNCIFCQNSKHVSRL